MNNKLKTIKKLIKNIFGHFSPSLGQSLVELLIVMALAAILFPALLAAMMTTRANKSQLGQRMQAIALLKETEESVRSARDSGWTSFATFSGTLHPVIAASKWTLASGVATTSGLTQQVVIGDVYRNSSGAIVTSGGTLDPSTKKADITVTWTQPLTSSITSTIYLSRTLPNYSSTHTTSADFSPGTLTQTQVTNTSGGEVKLANDNRAVWCSPSLSNTTITLPDGPPVAVAATASAVSTSIPNDVFVATAPNTSSSVKLAYLNVTANAASPAATLKGTFTLDSSKYSNASYVPNTSAPPTGIGLDNAFKTNDIKYYKSASKTYALLATDLPTKEVIAILVDDGNPSNDNTNNGEYQDYQANPKIYKYWTYFNTQIYPNATTTQSLDTGFLSPSADAKVTSSSGDNNGFETNAITRAYDGNDGSLYAADINSGTDNTTTNPTTNTAKDRHLFYNYNLSIPAGATINGIEVQLNADVKQTSCATTRKMYVDLSWNGGSSWTSSSDSTSTLGSSISSYALGGSSDTWGRTWSVSDFNNANFRVRVHDIANSATCEFRLDWAAVKVDYSVTVATNDQAPFGYGASNLTILGTTGYVDSGGYLYAFDLSTIDNKSSTSPLDQVGCRILLDGYDCQVNNGTDRKYSAGETGTSWSTTTSPAHDTCSDGGNIELNADHQLSGVQVGNNKYIYAAVGAGTDKELNIIDVTTPPTSNLTNSTCGRGSDTGWKVTGTLDFNPITSPSTEEAANSVYAKSDGTRAYMSSNGGIMHGSIADSDQFYIIDTSNKTSPKFLHTWPTTTSQHYQNTAQDGYYNGDSTNIQLYPRRALTVLNGQKAILVGQDGISDAIEPKEYQVLDLSNEQTPTYCGGLNYSSGFNDMTSVSELDGDNFVYMVTNDTQNWLKIIQGGADHGIYLDTGSFESKPFDATSSSAFNSFVANVTIPASTSISAQVAVAPPGSSGCSNATYQYIGPGGTNNASDVFSVKGASISASIPFGSYLSAVYQNPERCFKYKFNFSTTDTSNTPVLKDMTWNYSQ